MFGLTREPIWQCGTGTENQMFYFYDMQNLVELEEINSASQTRVFILLLLFLKD